MLSSIHPLGERARGNRWWLTVIAYLVASTASGLLAGMVLGLTGRVVGILVGHGATTPLLLTAVACLVGALMDGGGAKAPRLPGVRRQVNEDWLNRYRGWVYGAGFGLQLGLGVVTIVTTAAIYLTGMLAVATGWLAPGWSAALAGGAAVGAAFGLARALPLLLRARTNQPDRLRQAHRRLVAHDQTARWLTVGLLALSGTILGVAAAV
jgi:hypothetical protein